MGVNIIFSPIGLFLLRGTHRMPKKTAQKQPTTAQPTHTTPDNNININNNINNNKQEEEIKTEEDRFHEWLVDEKTFNEKKNKSGRPKTEIDWEEFDFLCGIQCTLNEIACRFHCDEKTIERAVLREKGIDFVDYFGKKRGVGKLALRRKQLQLAMMGDRTLLIFLGKNYLDQSDMTKVKLDHTGSIGTYDYLKTLTDEQLDRIITKGRAVACAGGNDTGAEGKSTETPH